MSLQIVARTTDVLGSSGLDLLFREARTTHEWLDRPVSDETLRALYDLMKFGPTSSNCCPARIVFLRTPEAKVRLRPAINPSNVEKIMPAPVTAIIGYDIRFFELLPRLFPDPAAVERFKDKPDHAERTAFRNGTLQGAYFIFAARSLGLDCMPISGFNNALVDEKFFSGTTVKSNFLCSLGYGDRTHLTARDPRLEFHEVCTLL